MNVARLPRTALHVEYTVMRRSARLMHDHLSRFRSSADTRRLRMQQVLELGAYLPVE